MTVLDLERKQNAAPLSEPGRIFKEMKVPLPQPRMPKEDEAMAAALERLCIRIFLTQE